MSAVVESLERRYEAIKPHLSERQRRIWLGSEARELGSGGVRVVADAVQVSPDTVRRGRSELDDPEPLPLGRSRGPGGGRKRAEEHDPELPAALDKLVDPDSRGDPMTPLRWTSKSLRSLADQLRSQGHRVSATLVRDRAFDTDILTSAVLEYPSGHCVFSVSTQTFGNQSMKFFGTTGRIEVPIPFNPPSMETSRIRVNDEAEEFAPCDQYTIQGDAFSHAIRNGGVPPVPLEDSLRNMMVIDAVFRSAESGKWETVEA